jgi:two-component system response regulator DctR
LLKEGTALSAEEVAEGVGLARVTARRYLDFLEKSGRVILELQYGSVGRPVNRYRTLE